MAIVIHPDGSSKAFAYTDIADAHRELGGHFDMVPGQIEAGFMVLAHDEGKVRSFPRNTVAEILTGYPEIYGPAAVVSFQEAGEDELLYRVRDRDREAFQRRLTTLTTAKREA